jgi:DNA-binding response OmpR family regulator
MDARRPADCASRSHLLVVDDDWETRELLSSYLGKQGFEVSTVEDGPAMDAWLEKHSTDLVILDLMLPGEDGLSIARRLGRAVLRRSLPGKEHELDSGDNYEFGPFRFDPGQRLLFRGSSEITLHRAEFDLLNVFVRHPNRVLSRDFIMDCLRGGFRDPLDRSVDVRVARLRHVIEADPADPHLIRTVWGVGYQFTPRGTEA